MAPSMLPYHKFWKMDENRQTSSEQEIAKRDRVREGRCVLQHVTTQFCKIDFSKKKISKKKCHFSVDFSHFRLISSHILIGGQRKRKQEGWMNKGGVRQATTTDIRCERKKQGDKKASERRANAR